MILFRCIPKYERLQQMAQRYPTLDVDATEAAVVMLAVSAEVSDAIRCHLAGYGVSEGRFLMLVLLLSNDRPLSHSELAELSGVTKGTITGLVDGLEQEGHVRREASEADRRVTTISLTPSGKAYLEGILPDHFRRMAALMSNLSAAERKTLVTLMMKVQAGIAKLKQSAEPGRDCPGQGPTAGC